MQLDQWELALEMYMTMERNGQKLKILPVMLDEFDNTAFRIDFSKFPRHYPQHPSSLRKYTVQKIVQGIFEFQGRKTSPDTIKEFVTLLSPLLPCDPDNPFQRHPRHFEVRQRSS